MNTVERNTRQKQFYNQQFAFKTLAKFYLTETSNWKENPETSKMKKMVIS